MSLDARGPGARPSEALEFTPSETAIRRALARARDGKSLDQGEAAVLLHARGADLDRLLGYASRARDAGLAAAGRPGVITYSRKVFIPLTRLCRDRCGYCTFATVPGRLDSPYLSPDQVLAIARQGAALGCKEALFTLGDRPEDRWPAARDWLDQNGYDDTLSYVRAMAIRVLEETGLLPHLNPGVRTRRSGCGCWRTPAAARSRSPRASSSASGRPARSARSRCSPSARSPGSTAASRKSSCRTSGPNPTPRCAVSPTLSWPTWRRLSR